MASAPMTLYTEESRCFEVIPNKKVDRKAEEKCPSLHLCLPVYLQWLLPVFSLDLASGFPPYHGMELFSQSSNFISQGREPNWTQFGQICKRKGSSF